MSAYNKITPSEDKSLLNIFSTNKDKNETNLFEMSNFFDIFIEDIDDNLHSYYQWEDFVDFGNLFGRLATAIKVGFDINDMGIMVADYSHFSKDVINGLKKGIYHIGESKEIAGNMRPAILDKDQHIVKWFTMKKAINPKEMLSNIGSLSMQNSLRQISSELKGINQNLTYDIQLNRRKSLSLPFINARNKFLKAINNPENKIQLLDQADTYLLEGLNSLYADIESEVERLSDSDLEPSKNTIKIIKKFFKGDLKSVDNILGHINEDMLMIPKYVAVEVYLLQHLERYNDAKDVIGQYKYHLDKMANTPLRNNKYTAAEIIHELYPYEKDNRDFWLKMPNQAISALDSLELIIEAKEKDIFLIEAESVSHEVQTGEVNEGNKVQEKEEANGQ